MLPEQSYPKLVLSWSLPLEVFNNVIWSALFSTGFKNIKVSKVRHVFIVALLNGLLKFNVHYKFREMYTWSKNGCNLSFKCHFLSSKSNRYVKMGGIQIYGIYLISVLHGHLGKFWRENWLSFAPLSTPVCLAVIPGPSILHEKF